VSQPTNNSGAYITGGTISGGAISFGAHSQAINNTFAAAAEVLDRKGLQEIRDRLQELEAAIQAHSSSLADHEEVVDSTKTVAEELAKEKPNKSKITSLLSGIAQQVQSVTVVATAVESLKGAIGTLL
jgi:hypothetical protein